MGSLGPQGSDHLLRHPTILKFEFMGSQYIVSILKYSTMIKTFV